MRRLASLLCAAVGGVIVTGCADSSPTRADEVPAPPPASWIAVNSQARAANPYAWVGDEHNRLLHALRTRSKELGVDSWDRGRRCRWIAEFVLTESRSSRAPVEMRRYWKDRPLDGAEFEAGTRRLGCVATDAPASVVARTTAGVRRSPGSASLSEGDTVDYVPSEQALALAMQLESGAQTSSSPAEYDQVILGIQNQATGLWDGEAVLVSASVASSSAHYWQSQGGGAPTQPWVPLPPGGGGGGGGPDCEPPECYLEFRSLPGIGTAHAEVDAIVKADVAGALSIWIGNGLGWKMTVRLGARVLLTGGYGFAAMTAASAAVWSYAAA